ncbi:MAG: hypothetical protein WD602_07420 [Actinomycetota bacterium]
MPEDDAANARAALRALWSMSGQMDSADRLGQEDEGGCCAPSHFSADDDAIGTTFQAQGGDPSAGVGFSAFAETNEPTFDRGEAASKFKEAWKSQLAMDGKLGKHDGSIKDAAADKSASRPAGDPQ